MARRRATTRVSDDGAAVQTAPETPSRFDRQMARLLEYATHVFYVSGYEGASMRDISRASGISLAGLYHYVESKEKLLFLIQRHAFATIVDRLRTKLGETCDPIERLRVFIANHLEYFLANMEAMKVLSHEDEVLTGDYGDQVRAIKREYFRICLELVSEARRAGLQSSPAARGASRNNHQRDDNRTAALILLGMMNWLYTWYKPRIDGGAERLSAQMSEMFLHGLLGAGACSAPAATTKFREL